MSTRTGGCLCGDIRYSVDGDPLFVAICHCRHCQKQAGSALSIIAGFPNSALTLTGNLTTFEDHGASGQSVYRKFCGRCGSPVMTKTPRADEEGMIFIKAGTLDDVSALQPTIHYWTKSAQPWVPLPEDATLLTEQ